MKTATRTALLVLMLLLGGATGNSAAATNGEWQVGTAVGGGFEAAWLAPEPLPVTSARPEILLDGRSLGYGSVGDGGREVSITVPGIDPPDPDRLDLRLSGRLLDDPEPRAAPSGRAAFSPAEAMPALGFDPGARGPHAIRSNNYTLPSFKYAGLKRKLEMVGHVVAPADPAVAAAGPLVLFLHGRHSTCYRPGRKGWLAGGWPCRKGFRPVPSQLGYDYLQRNLASQGLVTVSVAANGINGQDDVKPDGGANARSALVRRHLDRWSDWVTSGRRAADLDRVVLIGHSRGGEGVNRAAEEIPESAPYRVTGQILLAPTNFARQSAAYVPTVTVLPYCDGDVSDLQGQAYTDASIGLASGDASLKSSVTMFGANHNFFNTEWTPGVSKAPSVDDSWAPPRSLCGTKGKTRLTAAQQRRVAVSYVAGAVQMMTGTDDRNLALFDGSPARVGPVTKASVISQSVGGGKITLVAGRDAKPVTGSPRGVFTCRGYAGTGRRDCARYEDPEVTPHWPSSFPRGVPSRPALAMSWKKAGRPATLELGRELDLSGMASLDLRVVVDPSAGPARLGLALVDADGARVKLKPDGTGRVNPMPAGFAYGSRWLARTLRVPLPAPDPGTFDPARVVAITLNGDSKPDCPAGCRKASRVRVLDISARPGSILPTPATARLPLVRLKPPTRPQAGFGRRTVKVPFRVSGEVAGTQSRFRVVVDGLVGAKRSPQPITVRLVPGQKSGVVKIPYFRPRSRRAGRLQLDAYPIHGAIPVTSSVTIPLKGRAPR